MGAKSPKMEDGEVLDCPPVRIAPKLVNTTPQDRLAAILRRMGTDVPNYKSGAMEHRPTPAAPPTPPLNWPVAHPDTMIGFSGPSGFSQSHTGGGAGHGDGSPGPIPPQSCQSVPKIGGGSTGHNDGDPAPGPFPVARGVGGDRRNAGVVQRLSTECQRRRFNPNFKISMHENRYKCDILVQNEVIQGSKHYESPQDAKVHTAIKALKTVQSWPVPGPASMSGASGRHQEPQRAAKMETGKRTMHSSGPSSASGVDMSDPLQARAFVEGFRMGQLAGEPVGCSTDALPEEDDKKRLASLRSRSRSPRRSLRDSRHRSRTPWRYFDGSRHDPSLPSSDYYRPTGPPMWRRGADLVKESEDTYGRLKEDDYY